MKKWWIYLFLEKINIEIVLWVVRVWKGELYFVEALVFGMIKKRNLGFGAFVCLAL